MSNLAIDGGVPVIKEKLPTIADGSGRLFDTRELENVRDVLEKGTLAYIYGDKVREFERRFAELFGVTHAIAVSSGTAALHTAMVYADPNPGDEILVSPITDMGTVIPILYQQAVPVFVDIEPETQNMNPAMIEGCLSERTKGIIVTHIFGNPADMDPIMEIARENNLFVIEDAAQAHLAEYRGKPVGTIGNVGCFSLQQSKHITTGDGGMVISNEDKRFGRELRLCFDKGWPRNKPVRDHYFLAPNYHMTELQAAVGLAQIEKYTQCITNRAEAAAALTSLLNGHDGITPLSSLPDTKHSHFHYCVRLTPDRFRCDGAQFVRALQAEGLACELGYPGEIPLYLYEMIRDKKTFGSSGWPFTSPAARKRWDYPKGLCPEAEKACVETVVIPWNERLNERHVQSIAEAVVKVYRAYRR